MDAAQWMARLQQGDPEALEWLLTRYGGMLQYILGGMLEDPPRPGGLPGPGAHEAVGEPGLL